MPDLNVPMPETLTAFMGKEGITDPALRVQWELVRATYAVAERLEAVVEELKDIHSDMP